MRGERDSGGPKERRKKGREQKGKRKGRKRRCGTFVPL